MTSGLSKRMNNLLKIKMKLIHILFFLIVVSNTYSQTTIVFKPDAECGKDASMTNSATWDNGTMPNSIPVPNRQALRVEAWTANSNGSPEHDWRSVIEFQELKNIETAIVNSAILKLYAFPNYPYANGGQAEVNTSEIYRVIESWEEDQVTWVTQPNIDLNGVVEIPHNNNYDFIEVDLTEMVQTMIDNPDSSFGFLLRQKDESPYGSMNFASSDYPDFSRVPELTIIVDNIQYSNTTVSCADCLGIPNGTAVVDACGVCLAPTDPEFNQSCADCLGIPNGTAVLDACGVCLTPTDPEFNQSCADCLGILNGTAVLDACGVCLAPTDPEFNQSCADCLGIPNGIAVLDACGVCLAPTDPEFNQSCADCLGIPNGTAVVDACGVCLVPTDPEFNQSCIDCNGVPNGTAVIDSCDICLAPTDPEFNQSCADCNGIPNGTAVLDACGVCLELTDPNFNQSCLDKSHIYIPNAFSPNFDGINDKFQLFKNPALNAQIKKYVIFYRWGGVIYQKTNLSFNHNADWWDGRFKGAEVDPGVYVYYIEIEFSDGTISAYGGDITIIK